MSKHIAIAIVGYNNAVDILRCIAALEKSIYLDFEIVICENGGDEAFEILRSTIPPELSGHQRIKLIKASSNGGFASGINICMASTPEADAWWLLNPDTEAEPGALSALTARLVQGFHAVGGVLYLADGRVQSYGGEWKGWLARAVSIGNGCFPSATPDIRKIEQKQNYLMGASMLVGRTFFQIAGTMSEEFFLYCEEVDWCLRAKALGLRLGFASDAKVLHYQGTTTGNSTALKTRSKLAVYLDERNKILITKRHFPIRLPVAASAALLLLGLRYLGRGAFRQFFYGLSGWFAGVRGESGPPAWVGQS